VTWTLLGFVEVGLVGFGPLRSHGDLAERFYVVVETQGPDLSVVRNERVCGLSGLRDTESGQAAQRAGWSRSVKCSTTGGVAK